MSPHVLITENTTYCTDLEGVEVAASALPHLQRWMRENGYIHESEAPTATVHRMLATTPTPVVPTLEESMNERDELDGFIRAASNGGDYGPGQHIDCVLVEAAVDAILAAGYRKLEPVWAEGLLNDGEYEYTISSDCDGSNVKHWKRRPEMVVTQDPSAWEPR